jgi:hypothetical protein
MKINRCSDSGRLPHWIDGVASPDSHDAEHVASVPETMDDATMAEAFSRIEQCAQSGDNFYYSDSLDAKSKSQLREFAQVAGLPADRIAEVDAGRRTAAKALADARAAEEPERVPEQKPVVDFDLIPEETTEAKHFEENRDWDSRSAAQAMDYKPAGAMLTGSVIPIRGGETWEEDPVMQVRRGENSIAEPDAIQSEIDDEKVSSRDWIRQENEKRRSDRAFDREAWEAEFTAKLREGLAVVPKAGIVRTENPEPQKHTPNPQWSQSIMASGDAEPMPDRTLGETLAEKRDARRHEIQREDPEEVDWDSRRSSVPEKVSDLFYDSLKKNLDSASKKDGS